MIDYKRIYEAQAIKYVHYLAKVTELLASGKTTGNDHSLEMLQYTKMNLQRMSRVNKTTVLSEQLLNSLKVLKGKYHFLVITEGWCGDAAQIVPIIDKIVSAEPDKLDLRLVLRDEHLELIDAHLTNGGRAIPVLLVLDEQYNLVLPKWGPRPQILQDLLKDWKDDGLVMPALSEKIHAWYAKDKTVTTQASLNELLKQLH